MIRFQNKSPLVRRSFCLLLLLSVSMISSSAFAQRQKNYPPELPGASVETYKHVGDTELKLWIYKQETTKANESRPAIVFFFGGGWRSGSPAQFQHHCRYLAKQGMVAITADYRVLQRHETLADRAVADAKSAIRYVRKNADRLGIDPNRIVAAGGSAGGHLAACTDLVKTLDENGEDKNISSRPNAVAMFNPALMIAPWGAVDFDQEKADDIATRTGVPPQEISPIHQLTKDAAPSIIFHGRADTTVPYLTVEAYAKEAMRLGNQCELVGYEGEPHGFFNYGRGGNPGPAYLKTLSRLHEFLHQLGYLSAGPTGITPTSSNIRLREPLVNSLKAITDRKRATVAFIGGSITEMDGYRPMVSKWLESSFPETQFDFVNAGISSTCSTTGAFRLERDVLSSNPDLILIEFAVNDDQDASHSREACIRGMEGIIRHIKREHPSTDLVVTYFVNPPMLETWQQGKTPLSVAAHEQVMEHYGVSSVVLAKEIADRITAGSFTWKEYGGTHPAPAGNQIAANLVQDLLDTAWHLNKNLRIEEDTETKPEDAVKPLRKPIDPNSYQSGKLTDVTEAKIDADWTVGIPDWKNLRGSMRSRFENITFLHASKVDAELSLDFDGSAIGLFILAGPDAGQVEYSVDGQPFKTKDFYHRFSKGLHYPRTVMLEDQLGDGPHVIKMRVGKKAERENAGTAIRIMAFATNSSP
jgi:acetyl esterase/lipase/lysophospholipase L1-like esterase